jgi:predicted kinase
MIGAQQTVQWDTVRKHIVSVPLWKRQSEQQETTYQEEQQEATDQEEQQPNLQLKWRGHLKILTIK